MKVKMTIFELILILMFIFEKQKKNKTENEAKMDKKWLL